MDAAKRPNPRISPASRDMVPTIGLSHQSQPVDGQAPNTSSSRAKEGQAQHQASLDRPWAFHPTSATVTARTLTRPASAPVGVLSPVEASKSEMLRTYSPFERWMMESAVDSPYHIIAAVSIPSSVTESGGPNRKRTASDCRSLASTANATKGTVDGSATRQETSRL